MTNKNDGPDIWESVEIADLLRMKDENPIEAADIPKGFENQRGAEAAFTSPFTPPNLYLVDFQACETLEELTKVLGYLELMVDYDSAPEWIKPFLKKAED